MTRIETARLSLRPFEPDDDAETYEWFRDPLVMKYIPNGPDGTVEQTRARLAGYRRHQMTHGFSKWLVLERDSGRAIGDSGLFVLEEEGWTDLGFRFAATAWGRGFATEAASAWLRVAFQDLTLARLGAFSHIDNGASLAVLRKLGFEEVRRDTVMGMPSIVFAMEARRYQPG